MSCKCLEPASHANLKSSVKSYPRRLQLNTIEILSSVQLMALGYWLTSCHHIDRAFAISSSMPAKFPELLNALAKVLDEQHWNTCSSVTDMRETSWTLRSEDQARDYTKISNIIIDNTPCLSRKRLGRSGARRLDVTNATLSLRFATAREG